MGMLGYDNGDDRDERNPCGSENTNRAWARKPCFAAEEPSVEWCNALRQQQPPQPKGAEEAHSDQVSCGHEIGDGAETYSHAAEGTRAFGDAFGGCGYII